MYSNYIEEMVRKLASSGIIPHEKKEKAETILIEYWGNKNAIVWETDEPFEEKVATVSTELSDLIEEEERAIEEGDSEYDLAELIQALEKIRSWLERGG